MEFIKGTITHKVANNPDVYKGFLPLTTADMVLMPDGKTTIETQISNIANEINASNLINYPNLWPENVEIDFGNGLFGTCRRGTITVADGAVFSYRLVLGSVRHMASGGWINNNTFAANGSNPIGYPIQSAIGYIGSSSIDMGAPDGTNLNFMSVRFGVPRVNTPYFVWALYTKI